MYNLEINLQAGLRSNVENKAGNSTMERFPMSTSKTVSHFHPAPTATSQTNVQMVRGSNQAEVRKASPPNPPKKKIRTSKAERKARFRWEAEERKQIALGVYHNDDIPKVVNAARKEANRQYREGKNYAKP